MFGKQRHVFVYNKTRETFLAFRVAVADSILGRLVGLLGRKSLAPDSGVWIVPSNAVAFIEQVLAALAGTDLPGPAKLETIGLFNGAVRLFAQMEINQQRAGQDTAQWQGSLIGYLLQIAAAGQHPHLAAALAGLAAGGDPGEQEPMFDRAMTRILTGLLPPVRPADEAVSETPGLMRD